MTIKKVALGICVLALAGFGYYAISPIFKIVVMDEPLPQNSAEEESEEGVVEKRLPMPVIGTVGHPASGTARLVSAGGRNYVRYEDFKTLNGPDLYVYLAKDLDAKDFVSLGRVKATEGNINYEIPDSVDPREYTYVLTWCKAFGVLFNYAQINP